jgi:hypothetical protein
MKIYSQTNSDISTFNISFDELNHDPHDIFSVLGYTEGEAPEHLYFTFNEVIAEAGEYCNIQAGLVHFSDIHHLDNNWFRVNDAKFDIGKTISVQLRKINSVIVFVCTIGPGLETWAKQLMNEGDFFKGYMADAIASQSVELAIDKVQDHFEKDLAKQGLKITNRYSPGYCGWHVSEQQKLFSLLPENFCNVQLTDSSLMLPIKSVSGIIGIGKNVRKMDYTCRLCDMTDCVYRRRFEKIPQDA